MLAVKGSITTYILIGSNLGNRGENMQNAFKWLRSFVGPVVKASGIYESEPWGVSNQPPFLNQVIAIETLLNPQDLLFITQTIESVIGPKKKKKWGSRIIDIDILFYGSHQIQTDSLIIPHNQLQKRNFTLVPLNEIAGGFIHPVLKLQINQLLEQSPDHLKVIKLELYAV